MQRQAAEVSDVYLNASSLKISGDKIKLQKFPHEAKPSYNVKRISLSPAPQPAPPRHPNRSSRRAVDCFATRQTCKVSVKNYTNRDVHSRQLREIYEAVECEDFRRFLSRNPVVARRHAPALCEASLSAVDASSFYRDHFEVHYNFLKSLVRSKQRQCPKSTFSGD